MYWNMQNAKSDILGVYIGLLESISCLCFLGDCHSTVITSLPWPKSTNEAETFCCPNLKIRGRGEKDNACNWEVASFQCRARAYVCIVWMSSEIGVNIKGDSTFSFPFWPRRPSFVVPSPGPTSSPAWHLCKFPFLPSHPFHVGIVALELSGPWLTLSRDANVVLNEHS